MKQDLKLSEKLFSLAVNPTRGGIIRGTYSLLGITLSGLVLLELMRKGLISIDNGIVRMVDPSIQQDEIHEYFMKHIRRYGKDRKVRTWISWFNSWPRKLQKAFIRQLMRKNVLRMEERRFLFIPYDKVFLMDRALVASISSELKDTLLRKTESKEDTLILALMAEKTNLLGRIIPDRAERKVASSNLKKIPETPVVKAVKEAVQMMHAGYVAATS
ncbi:MAG TPA: GPP34 family phosphoprotein [Prolixibacteraceae bacterium]|nr:GPP34 family phosphoprotein [Prolixibacteraceae bacterium]